MKVIKIDELVKQAQVSFGLFGNPNITDAIIDLVLAQPDYVMQTNMISSANLHQARIDAMIKQLENVFLPQIFSSIIRNPNLNVEQINQLIHLNLEKGQIEHFDDKIKEKLTAYSLDERNLLLSMNGDSTAVPLTFLLN